MDLAAILVHAKTLAPVVKAVRSAYRSIGAVEVPADAAGIDGAMRVVIGKPKHGWAVITDSARHTVDLGVAEAISAELGKGTRVVAVGMRGSSARGKAASKAYGTWKSRPPSSGKPAALRKVIDKLGEDLLPRPWEMDARPGEVLAFDVSRATLTPGPFKTNTASELRAAEQGAQIDATWWISNHALNGRYKDAEVPIGGLRDTFGWQYALDALMHSLYSHAMKLERGSAQLYLRIAERTLDGVTTANLRDRWVVTVGAGIWSIVRHGVALLCALVAGDERAWTRYVAAVAPEHRERVGLLVWRRSPKAIAALASASRAWLERDFAPRDLLVWALTGPHDPAERWLDDAAELAAIHGDVAVIERACREAATDRYLRGSLHQAAYGLVREGEYRAALALFDHLIAMPPEDLTVFANALYAVQADNSKLPVDPQRARRYVEAARPYAEANPPIYINIACVEQELGNRAEVLAALAAAKKHRLKNELAELRDAALFKSLRKDPEFVKLVGAAR